MNKLTVLIALTGIAIAGPALAAEIDWSKLPPAAKTENVTFEKDIAPIFKESCLRCHGAERPRAQLRLDTLEGVLKGSKDGAVVKAGDSASSLLVKSVSQLDPKIAMPPKPRARPGQGGPGGPGGPDAPAMQPHDGGPGGGPDVEKPHMGGEGDHGSPQDTNAPGQRPRNFGPPAKPLTPEQVGLIRAWIDQGAK